MVDVQIPGKSFYFEIYVEDKLGIPSKIRFFAGDLCFQDVNIQSYDKHRLYINRRSGRKMASVF